MAKKSRFVEDGSVDGAPFKITSKAQKTPAELRELAKQLRDAGENEAAGRLDKQADESDTKSKG